MPYIFFQRRVILSCSLNFETLMDLFQRYLSRRSLIGSRTSGALSNSLNIYNLWSCGFVRFHAFLAKFSLWFEFRYFFLLVIIQSCSRNLLDEYRSGCNSLLWIENSAFSEICWLAIMSSFVRKRRPVLTSSLILFFSKKKWKSSLTWTILKVSR